MKSSSPHWTQTALATELGVSQQAISSWLRGRCLPSAACMLRLEEKLGIPMRAWLEPSDGRSLRSKARTTEGVAR
jgi:transcriptional regulator with XRE-family HTH domain